MATYTFYPADNSATVVNVAAPKGAQTDAWGCIGTASGVYVPMPNVQIDFVSLEPTPGPYTDIFGKYHAE